eukprot:scaffold1389_cov176-Skeletonema_marinoi.AAC.1
MRHCWTCDGNRMSSVFKTQPLQSSQQLASCQSICVYYTNTIINYNWPLQAVHCYIHSVQQIWCLNVVLAAIPNGPHQVTYDVLARLIQLQRE